MAVAYTARISMHVGGKEGKGVKDYTESWDPVTGRLMVPRTEIGMLKKKAIWGMKMINCNGRSQLTEESCTVWRAVPLNCEKHWKLQKPLPLGDEF